MINTAISSIQEFSNREIAIAFWILVTIVLGFSHRKIRKSLFSVIKAFFAWKLAISYALMFSYISIMLLLLDALGAWRFTHLPNIMLWVACVAFVMLFEYSKVSDPNFFKNAIKDNLRILIVFEFFVNLHVFNLWIELLLVALFVILGGMIAIAETDEKLTEVRTILNYIVIIMGLGITVYSLYMVLGNFGHFATLENFENFYLPILLYFIFLPFIYFVALYAAYDSLFLRLRYFINDISLLKYMKRRTLLAIGINLWMLDKWSGHINTQRFNSEKEIDETILEFKNRHSSIKRV